MSLLLKLLRSRVALRKPLRSKRNKLRCRIAIIAIQECGNATSRHVIEIDNEEERDDGSQGTAQCARRGG